MDGEGSRIMKRHDLDTFSFDTFQPSYPNDRNERYRGNGLNKRLKMKLEGRRTLSYSKIIPNDICTNLSP